MPEGNGAQVMQSVGVSESGHRMGPRIYGCGANGITTQPAQRCKVSALGAVPDSAQHRKCFFPSLCLLGFGWQLVHPILKKHQQGH